MFGNKLKNLINITISIVLLFFPAILASTLKHLSVRVLALTFLTLVILKLFYLPKKTSFIAPLFSYISQLCTALILILATAFNSLTAMLLIPVLINVSLFLYFLSTLVLPPSAIFRLATIFEKKEPPVTAKNYCTVVTIIWALFFILNGAVALYTAFYCSLNTWSLYNGFISYLIIGSIFSIEFLIRMRVKKIISASSTMIYIICLSQATHISYAQDLILPTHNISANELKPLLSELTVSSYVESHFVQSRYVKLLSKPITSTGTFKLLKGSEINWNFEKPLKQSITINHSGIKISDEFGGKSDLSSSHSAIKIITNILLSIFSSDFTSLEEYFWISYAKHNSQWQIGLKSKSHQLKGLISTVLILGENEVQKVVINEESGDSTVISFSNTKRNDKFPD